MAPIDDAKLIDAAPELHALIEKLGIPKQYWQRVTFDVKRNTDGTAMVACLRVKELTAQEFIRGGR